MRLFVVLATRARDYLLARTLDSLARCRRPESFGGTFVVENGERGDTARVVRAAPAWLAVHHFFEPAANKSRALNCALSAIDDGLIVFLDDDVRLAPEVLEAYDSAAREGTGRFFGGPVEPDYEEPPPEWLREFLPPSARGWKPRDLAQLSARPFFLGFNWAAFARDLRRVGGFSERFGPGSDIGAGDESDVQRRLAAAGVQAVYVREALVHHWVPRVRCSPEWTLQRAYREGVRRGAVKAAEIPGPFVAGYPLGLVRRTAKSWLRANVRRLSGEIRERFAAQVTYHRHRGVLHGAALARRTPIQVPHNDHGSPDAEASIPARLTR